MQKVIRPVSIFLFSSPLFCVGLVLAHIESSKINYERALGIFYEARRSQSLGNFVKALQKYEEAFRMFQEVSNDEQGPLRLQARKRMNQIERDVQRLEAALRKESVLTSLETNRYADPQGTLQRFQEWRRQEEQNKKGMR